MAGAVTLWDQSSPGYSKSGRRYLLTVGRINRQEPDSRSFNDRTPSPLGMWDKKERKGLEKDSKPCAFWLVVLFIKTTLTRKEESGKEVASSGFNIRFSCCVMG